MIGKPLTAGNEVYFDYVNSEGGIAGKYKVELVQEDTQYSPPTHRPAVQQDQEQRRGVHAGARHRADARHPAAARAGQHHRRARLARRVLGARAEPAAGRRALPDPGDQRARLLHQPGRRQGQEHLLVHPGRRLRRGRPVGRRLRGREARLRGRRHAEVQGRRQGRDRPGPAAPGLQVRRRLPRRHADRRGHDLGHGRQARLRAALDRPVADVDRRARRLAAGASTSQQTTWIVAEGTEWGDDQRARHEGHDGPASRSSSPTRSRTTTSRSATCRASP